MKVSGFNEGDRSEFLADFALSTVGLTIPVRRQPSAAGEATIKGTVTYFFNSNYGNKPDTGAKVWLLTEESARKGAELTGGTFVEPIPKNWVCLEMADSGKISAIKHDPAEFKPVDFDVVSKVVADGNGNFLFEKVQAGSYLIVMQSNHTSGGVTVSGPFTRDLARKIRFIPVTVRTGQTADASFDFGPSEGPLVPVN